MTVAPARLRPFVSMTALRWPNATGEPRWIDGTMMSIDVVGFTALTERLARDGRGGAERITGILDSTFTAILAELGAHGGDVLRFGGDALRVIFAGAGHSDRAAAAGIAIPRVVARTGDPRSATRPLQLAVRVGAHRGRFVGVVVGEDQRELMVVGPGVTRALRNEAAAPARGMVASAARGLPPTAASPVSVRRALAGPSERSAARFVAPSLRALLGREQYGEHRRACLVFVQARGIDRTVRHDGLAAAGARLRALAAAIEHVGEEYELTWINSDVIVGGVQLTLAADLPRGGEFAAERALRGARALVDRLGVAVQIGVHASVMFAGEMGAPTRRTYTIMGDGVNLAARLATMAAPGSVVATIDTANESSMRFALGPRRTVALKGRSQLTTVVRVGREGTRRTGARQQGATTGPEFVGRRRELGRLQRALAAVVREGHGTTVEIVAAPGLGKTRLLDEFVARAQGAAVRVTCDPYATTRPYHATADLLRGLLMGGDGPNHARRRLRAALKRAGVTADAAARLERIVGPAAAPEAPELGATFGSDAIHAAVVALIDAIVPGPLVFAVDDAQWLDPSSRALFEMVSRSTAERPWLVVLARRPPAGARRPDRERIELQPLSHADTRRLVGGSRIARHDRDVERIVAASRGNPFFALELADVGGSALPGRVEQLAAQRVDLLLPNDRALLRDAAALGTEVDLALLAAVRKQPTEADQLARLGAFVTTTTTGRLRFRHELFRAAAYEGLAHQRRQAIHAIAARWLARRDGADPGEIAAHAAAAGLDRLTWTWSRRAATAATVKVSWPEASVHLEHALRAARAAKISPRNRFALAGALGDALVRAGETQRADHEYRAALRLAPTAIARARTYLALADIAERTARYRAATTRVASGLRCVASVPGPAAAVVAHGLRLTLAAVHWDRGDARRSAEICRSVADSHAGRRDKRLLGQACIQLEQALDSLDDPVADEYAALGVRVLTELGDDYRLGLILGNWGYSAYNRGQWTVALERYTAAERAYERCGRATMRAVVLNNRALILLDQGRISEADAAFTAAHRTFRAVDFADAAGITEMNLARIAAYRGDTAAATARLRACRAQFREIGSTMHDAEMATYELERLVVAGRYASALRATTVARRALDDHDAPPALRLVSARLHADALVCSGRTKRGRAGLEHALETAIDTRSPHDELLILEALRRAGAAAGLSEPRDRTHRRRALNTQLGMARGASRWVGYSPIVRSTSTSSTVT